MKDMEKASGFHIFFYYTNFFDFLSDSLDIPHLVLYSKFDIVTHVQCTVFTHW